MRKVLFILSALLLTGGGLSAQSHGHRQHALNENRAKGATELQQPPKVNKRAEDAKKWLEAMSAKIDEAAKGSAAKGGAAKDGIPIVLDPVPGPGLPVPGPYYGGSDMLNVIPNEPFIDLDITRCGQTVTKPIVVKNTTTEPINAVINVPKTAQPGRKLNDDMVMNLNFVNGDAYGFVYDFSEEFVGLVKYDTKTWEQVAQYPQFNSIAYCGNTYWGTFSGDDGGCNLVVALDENLVPTGFSFETELDYPMVVADGDNLIVYGAEKQGEGGREYLFHAMAYNTKGEKIADYGSIPMPKTEIIAYNPATRTFWFGGCRYELYGDYMGISVAYQINNGKLELADVIEHDDSFFGYFFYVGFDNNGQGYLVFPNMMKSSMPFGLFEGKYTMDMQGYSAMIKPVLTKSPMPFGSFTGEYEENAGIKLSRTVLNLQPGEQATINVTASAEAGNTGFPITAMSFEDSEVPTVYFTRYIEVNVDIMPEYEFSDTLFTAFKDSYSLDTVWYKNTGCVPVYVGMPYLKYRTAFSSVYPYTTAFSSMYGPNSYVNPGDSLGLIIEFAPETAGEIVDTLYLGQDFRKVALKGTGLTPDFTIAKTAVDTTLKDCIETLVVADKITNNTNVPMNLIADNVQFKIHTGGEEGNMYFEVYDNTTGRTVYGFPDMSSTEYNTDYVRDFIFPAGSYTFEFYGGGEFGWNGGYVDLTVNGKKVLSEATYPAYSLRPTPVTFTVGEPMTIASVPAKSSIESFSVPANLLTLPGFTTLHLVAEGNEQVSFQDITIGAFGGKADFSVASSLDFGNVYDYKSDTLILYNNGCAPVSFKDVYFKYWNHGHRDYFKVDNKEAGEDKPYTSLDDIEPYSSVKLPVSVYPDSVGPFKDTLVFSVEGLGKFEVPMVANGVKGPEAEFKVSTVKDTADYGTQLITVSSNVKNTGGSNLIMTQPICISYNAGSKEYYGEFEIYDEIYNYVPNSEYGNSWDFNRYVQLEPGKYKLAIYRDYSDYADNDSYVSVISGTDTIVNKIMLRDIFATPYYFDDNFGYVVNFTLTDDMIHRDTIAPGATLALTMDIPLRGWYVSEKNNDYTFSKKFLTNDNQHSELTLNAEICVEGELDIVVPETIDFGNVGVGMYAEQTIHIPNNGGIPFEAYENSITGTGAGSFIAKLQDEWGYSEIWPGFGADLTVRFSPTAAGAAEAKFALSNGDSTINVTLKGTGVAAPALKPLFGSDTVRLEAECGQTEVTATYTITNNGSTPVRYVTKPQLIVNTGTKNPQNFYVEIYDYEKGEWMEVISWGTYNQTGITDKIYLDLPAGDYKLEYWWDGDEDKANDGWVSLVFNGETLVDELEIYDNEEFTITDTFEDIVVEANSSTEVEWTINIPQLEDFDYDFNDYMNVIMGEYYYDGKKRILERYGSQEPVLDTLVARIQVNVEPELTFTPDEVKFVDAHVGTETFASVTIENTGCLPYIIYDDFELVAGQYFQLRGQTFAGKYEYNSSQECYYLNPGASAKFYFSFSSNYKTGTFRDALKLETVNPFTGPENIIIPLAATATSTQVMEVSTPATDGSYRAGDTLIINVTFDDYVELDSTKATGLPQLLMNTGGYAVLDTANFDGYTLQFRYPIAATDNVDKLEIKEIIWNGYKVIEFNYYYGEPKVMTITELPANTEFAAASQVTLDNILPTYTLTTSALETIDSNATITVAFSEEVTGFAESNITLSEGASITAFTTADNITYVAELSLPHADSTFVNVAATAADLAGNTVQVAWDGKFVTRHDFDTTVFAATFDSVGYTMLVCKICGDTTYIDTVPVLEVKIVDVAFSNLPKKLTYTEGDKIDLTGAKLTLTFNNGTTKVVDLTSAMISGFDAKKTGKQTITVTYVEDGETFSFTFDININAKPDETAIAENAAEINIYAFNRTIVVEAAEAINGEIAVFDVNGRMIAKELAAGTRTEIEMPAEGIYIVSVNGESKRVAVY